MGEKPSHNVFTSKLMSESKPKQKNLLLEDDIFDIAPRESENSKVLDRRLTSKFSIPFENSQVSNNAHTSHPKSNEFSNSHKKLMGHVRQSSFGNDCFGRHSRATSNPKSLSKQMTFGGVEGSRNAVLKGGIEELSTFRSSKFL